MIPSCKIRHIFVIPAIPEALGRISRNDGIRKKIIKNFFVVNELPMEVAGNGG